MRLLPDIIPVVGVPFEAIDRFSGALQQPLY